MSNLIGKKLLGHYQVLEFIGRGGMAEVYKVWDSERMDYFAIKVLHQDLAVDKIFMRRFEREAHKMKIMQHPNIVRFYEIEKEGRFAFMVLDYIEGESLKPRIFDHNGPYPLDETRRVLRSICGALAYVHSKGFVHCDIKPANILVTKWGRALLSDFGISRMADATTATMVGIGTPSYMAPEQIRGEDPVPQTDIYALGILLYEMLTGGERPFTGEKTTTGSTGENIRWEQIHMEPPSPRLWNKNLTIAVEEVIFKTLSKEISQRYSDSIELLNAFEEAIGDGKIIDLESLNSEQLAIQREEEIQKTTKKKFREIPFEKIPKIAWILGIFILFIFVLSLTGKSNSGRVYTDYSQNAIIENNQSNIQLNKTPTEKSINQENNSLSPSPTKTKSPTRVPEKATESLVNSQNCLWDSDFVSETIPDNTVFSSGEIFRKTWRVKNSGTCNWTIQEGLKWMHTRGDLMGATTPLYLDNSQLPIKPGETIDISVVFTAPNSPGTYISYWWLSNSEDLFGIHPYVQIIVKP